MADWAVIKDTALIASGSLSVTVTPPLPVLADPLVDSFAIITGTRYSGLGVTSGGGNQDLDRFTTVVQDPEVHIAAGQAVFRRLASPAVNCRVDYEFWCWIGAAGASHRWRVLRQESMAISALDLTVDSGTFTPSDPTRVVVVLTGQACGEAGRNNANRAQFTTSLVSVGGGSYVARATRGVQGVIAPNDRVSLVVLELGAWWRPVQRIEFRSDDPDRPDIAPGAEQRAWGVGLEGEYGILDFTRPTLPRSGLAAGLNPLLDITRTLVQVQYRNAAAGTQGNDDNGENAELGSEAALIATAAAAGHHNDGAGHAPVATALNSLITRRSTGTGDTSKRTVVWFLEYDPPLTATHTIPMVVQHLHRYFAAIGVGEEEVDDITDPTPHPWLPAQADLGDLGSSGVAFGLCSSSSGTGAGSPRGWTGLRLTAASPIDVRMTRSESAQDERQSMSVSQMPSAFELKVTVGERSEAAMAGSLEGQIAVAGSQASEAAVARG